MYINIKLTNILKKWLLESREKHILQANLVEELLFGSRGGAVGELPLAGGITSPG